MKADRRITAICILVLGVLISGCGPGGLFGPARIVSIAAGGYHNCVLTSAGGIKCWGNNDAGQLGDGTTIQQSTPVDVIGMTSGVSAIAAGAEHTCALTTGGGVKCWGRNFVGEIGNGKTQPQYTPVDVSGLSSGVRAIAVYGDHSCALTSKGGVKCWGEDFHGYLYKDTAAEHLTPVDVSGLTTGIIAIAVGGDHACALTSVGGVKCWGNNDYGQLGIGTTNMEVKPVDVIGLTSGVEAITSGGDQSCALTSAGKVKCWGTNGHNEVGNGNGQPQATAVDVIGLTSRITSISAGFFHTCALTSTGGVKCWGGNYYGQLGDGTTNGYLTAVDVSGLTGGVTAITANGDHTCALTSKGVVKCWGNSFSGQFIDSMTFQWLTPVGMAEFHSVAPTATPRVIPTSTAGPSPIPSPTLIPAIEPANLPGLLQSAFSIEILDPFGGHSLRRITGWKNGFNSGTWKNENAGYQWMDANHLLLYPVIGETQSSYAKHINTRPVVINVEIGKVWLPPLDPPAGVYKTSSILLPRWSSDLGVLITSENAVVGNAAKAGVTTYTSDGNPIAHYPGKLVDVSPSGNKILNADDTWIDLRSGKTVHFTWGSGVFNERWLPIWSPDETRVYFCCYFYGDARTGASYTISDENTILDGHPDDNMQGLHHSSGIWLNDNYVLAQFDGIATYRDGFLPVFDIAARTFRNLGKIANLPDAFNNLTYTYYSISPNGDYMRIGPGLQSQIDPQVYLVDLKTLKSQLYHSNELDWSANGKYALLDSQVLTLSNKQLRPLPALPGPHPRYSVDSAWHPTEAIRASITADAQRQLETLNLLDVRSLSYRQVGLPTDFVGKYYRSAIFWSPQGDHIAMLAADNSLWQIDYPKLQKLEQLTPPLAGVKEVLWSPDGTHLSFINGTDIYIVDTKSNP